MKQIKTIIESQIKKTRFFIDNILREDYFSIAVMNNNGYEGIDKCKLFSKNQ
jgi:hypothetical protein